MINSDLIEALIGEFKLKANGMHGPAHWARVLMNGRILAEETGADMEVVSLFAVLHDCKRKNSHDDPDHGKRAADFAETLRGLLFELDDEAFNLLYDACAYHHEGGTTGPITIQTCWDADRLDLGRMGSRPKPEVLCTLAAADPEILEPAYERASERFVPKIVTEEWNLNLTIKKKSSWF